MRGVGCFRRRGRVDENDHVERAEVACRPQQDLLCGIHGQAIDDARSAVPDQP